MLMSFILTFTSFCSDDSTNSDPASKSSAMRMRNLTRVTHLLIADIESGGRQYRQLFRQTLNIDYVELAFKEYENQLRLSAKSIIRLAIQTRQSILSRCYSIVIVIRNVE